MNPHTEQKPQLNVDALIRRMEAMLQSLPALLTSVTPEEAHWRPDGGGWSIVEIVNHLADEEVEDFRTRLRMTLEDPAAPWPKIDPEGAARERDSNSRPLASSLQRFLTERRASLEWLRSLGEVGWATSHQHIKIGPLLAGDLLAAWCDHNILHLRQIVKRFHQLTQRDAGPYSTAYAGDWTA